MKKILKIILTLVIVIALAWGANQILLANGVSITEILFTPQIEHNAIVYDGSIDDYKFPTTKEIKTELGESSKGGYYIEQIVVTKDGFAYYAVVVDAEDDNIQGIHIPLAQCIGTYFQQVVDRYGGDWKIWAEDNINGDGSGWVPASKEKDWPTYITVDDSGNEVEEINERAKTNPEMYVDPGADELDSFKINKEAVDGEVKKIKLHYLAGKYKYTGDYTKVYGHWYDASKWKNLITEFMSSGDK